MVRLKYKRTSLSQKATQKSEKEG